MIIGIIGLITNFITLYNKKERIDFVNNIKEYLSSRKERV